MWVSNRQSRNENLKSAVPKVMNMLGFRHKSIVENVRVLPPDVGFIRWRTRRAGELGSGEFEGSGVSRRS